MVWERGWKVMVLNRAGLTEKGHLCRDLNQAAPGGSVPGSGALSIACGHTEVEGLVYEKQQEASVAGEKSVRGEHRS